MCVADIISGLNMKTAEEFRTEKEEIVSDDEDTYSNFDPVAESKDDIISDSLLQLTENFKNLRCLSLKDEENEEKITNCTVETEESADEECTIVIAARGLIKYGDQCREHLRNGISPYSISHLSGGKMLPTKQKFALQKDPSQCCQQPVAYVPNLVSMETEITDDIRKINNSDISEENGAEIDLNRDMFDLPDIGKELDIYFSKEMNSVELELLETDCLSWLHSDHLSTTEKDGYLQDFDETSYSTNNFQLNITSDLEYISKNDASLVQNQQNLTNCHRENISFTSNNTNYSNFPSNISSNCENTFNLCQKHFNYSPSNFDANNDISASNQRNSASNISSNLFDLNQKQINYCSKTLSTSNFDGNHVTSTSNPRNCSNFSSNISSNAGDTCNLFYKQINSSPKDINTVNFVACNNVSNLSSNISSNSEDTINLFQKQLNISPKCINLPKFDGNYSVPSLNRTNCSNFPSNISSNPENLIRKNLNFSQRNITSNFDEIHNIPPPNLSNFSSNTPSNNSKRSPTNVSLDFDENNYFSTSNNIFCDENIEPDCTSHVSAAKNGSNLMEQHQMYPPECGTTFVIGRNENVISNQFYDMVHSLNNSPEHHIIHANKCVTFNTNSALSSDALSPVNQPEIREKEFYDEMRFTKFDHFDSWQNPEKAFDDKQKINENNFRVIRQHKISTSESSNRSSSEENDNSFSNSDNLNDEISSLDNSSNNGSIHNAQSPAFDDYIPVSVLSRTEDNVCKKMYKDVLKELVDKSPEVKLKIWAKMAMKKIKEFLKKNKHGLNLIQDVAKNEKYNLPTAMYAAVKEIWKQASKKELKDIFESSPQVLEIVALRNEVLVTNYIAEFMIDQEMELNQVDAYGRNIIHKILNAKGNYSIILEHLLNLETKDKKLIFDINQKDNAGNTPLQLAYRRTDHGKINGIDERQRIIELLIAHGAKEI